MSDLTIRPIRSDDAADLHAALTHPRVVAQTRRLPTLTVGAVREQLAQSRPDEPRLVAERGGRALGCAMLHRSRNPRRAHGARLELIVHPAHWRQGVGSALLAASLEMADQWLNLLRVELDVISDNLPARALVERFGFETEGVQRRAVYGPDGWCDSVMMARLRRPTYEPPLTPLPPPQPERVSSVGEVMIRPMRAEDAKALYAIITDPGVARTVAMPPFTEASSVVRRFAAHSDTDHVVVAACDGRLVGSASLHLDPDPRRRGVAALAMSVLPAYWGHGIGTRLMHALIDLADNWLNVQRTELEVNSDNPAGVRLYEKFGFEREGVKRLHIYGAGRFADSYMMARLVSA